MCIFLCKIFAWHFSLEHLFDFTSRVIFCFSRLFCSFFFSDFHCACSDSVAKKTDCERWPYVVPLALWLMSTMRILEVAASNFTLSRGFCAIKVSSLCPFPNCLSCQSLESNSSGFSWFLFLFCTTLFVRWCRTVISYADVVLILLIRLAFPSIIMIWNSY